MTLNLIGPGIDYMIHLNKNREYIEVYDYNTKTAFKLIEGNINGGLNKPISITLKKYEIIPWPFNENQEEKKNRGLN